MNIQPGRVCLYAPRRFLTSKGIIKDVGFSVQEEDFLKEVRRGIRVIGARRRDITIVEGQNVTYVSSKTSLVIFEGNNRPNEIEIFACLTKVHLYITPVSQCFNCLKFGHKGSQCRSKNKCAFYSQNILTSELLQDILVGPLGLPNKPCNP